jgi:hypothetical protein
MLNIIIKYVIIYYYYMSYLIDNIVKNINVCYNDTNKLNDLKILIELYNIPYVKMDNGVNIELKKLDYELLYIINKIINKKSYIDI